MGPPRHQRVTSVASVSLRRLRRSVWPLDHLLLALGGYRCEHGRCCCHRPSLRTIVRSRRPLRMAYLPRMRGTNGRTHEPEYREGDSFYESLKYGNKVVQRADIYDNSTYAKHVFECSMDCSFQNGTPCFVSGTSHAEPIGSSPEVFLPGLIVHIVPENRSLFPLWRSWGTQGNKEGYKAFVARRENFEDVVVSPFMFLDHLPWRCHYALQRVLEAWKEDKLRDDPVDGLNLV